MFLQKLLCDLFPLRRSPFGKGTPSEASSAVKIQDLILETALATIDRLYAPAPDSHQMRVFAFSLTVKQK